MRLRHETKGSDQRKESKQDKSISIISKQGRATARWLGLASRDRSRDDRKRDLEAHRFSESNARQLLPGTFQEDTRSLYTQPCAYLVRRRGAIHKKASRGDEEAGIKLKLNDGEISV